MESCNMNMFLKMYFLQRLVVIELGVAESVRINRVNAT